MARHFDLREPVSGKLIGSLLLADGIDMLPGEVCRTLLNRDRVQVEVALELPATGSTEQEPPAKKPKKPK